MQGLILALALTLGQAPAGHTPNTLLEREGSVELRLKHVNADMTGWEEKNDFVTFKLVKLEPRAAWFSGLTFRRVGDDGLEEFLALRNRTTGEATEQKFVYRRVR